MPGGGGRFGVARGLGVGRGFPGKLATAAKGSKLSRSQGVGKITEPAGSTWVRCSEVSKLCAFISVIEPSGLISNSLRLIWATLAKITYIEHNGTEHAVEAEIGSTVMEAAIQNPRNPPAQQSLKKCRSFQTRLAPHPTAKATIAGRSGG